LRVQKKRNKKKAPCFDGAFFVTIKNMGRKKTWWNILGTQKNIVKGSVIIGIMSFGVAGVVLWNVFDRFGKPVETVAQSPIVSDSVIRHPLTGVLLSEEKSVLPYVFGVMIENAADAWPLSGVNDAFLVIEAPVEGSIPRFLAFYSDDQITDDPIGPVRSSRPYYLDWVEEFDAVYVHVGGAPAALEAIKQRGIVDLDQFFQSEYFYRNTTTRYAPHNVYITHDALSRSLDEMNARYDHEVPDYASWSFAESSVSSDALPLSIHIAWSNASLYDIEWKYSPSTNEYMRTQGGVTYAANNVIAVVTDIATIPGDDKGRKTVRTIGEGVMHLFHNGEEIIGTWKKPIAQDRLRFYDEDGDEIAMNPGKTWIEILSSRDRFTVEKEMGDEILEEKSSD
jgi:hypothetical protein